MKSAKRSQGVTRYRDVTTPTVTPSSLSGTQHKPERYPVTAHEQDALIEDACTRAVTPVTMGESAVFDDMQGVTKSMVMPVGATLTAPPELLAATRAAIANKVLSQADRYLGNALLKELGNPDVSHENQQSAIQRLHDLMATVGS